MKQPPLISSLRKRLDVVSAGSEDSLRTSAERAETTGSARPEGLEAESEEDSDSAESVL